MSDPGETHRYRLLPEEQGFALTLFFLMIGISLWVRVEGRENLWGKVKRSLKLEKKESMDLINALIRPAGARTILDVLHKLAMIDKTLDAREMAFVQAFADRWKIKIDFRKAFDSVVDEETDQMHIDLREKYLNTCPFRRTRLRLRNSW